MPQAIAAVTAFATWVGAEVGGFAAAATGSVAVGGTVANIAFAATEVGIYAGFTAGLAALSTPRLPDPAALQTPLKQPMPPRQSAFGRVRVSGFYALYVAGEGGAKTTSNDILALLDGRSTRVVSYYLNDDLMAVNSLGYWYAPGAYGKYGQGDGLGNLVQIDSRLGFTPETPYPLTGNVPFWTSDHRGDGVTSMVVICKQAHREDQASCFPNGVPLPSAVVDAQLIWDPRDGGQTHGDPSTYVFSDNAPLCLLAYLTDASGGMGLDYNRFLAPTIGYLKAAADEADGLVSTSGMHATLLDAAAAGDTKIFLGDTTGLSAGVEIDLGTEKVTVSSVGLAGEVDITGTLALAHSAGELAYWDATGQSARYRCAGTYRHDSPPGDVIKQILSTFDGWMQPRGDGAIVVRTNTIYAPSVVLTDRHVLGYQVQHFLPDEQATNQFIVSYTDPAAAFNKAEAGYVQDDIDIAQRGQVRSQNLDLSWIPSGPQAITVARAMLARATQPLRGTLTCNLAGLAVMGERYVRVQIAELPALNDLIVEVTGRVAVDLSTMTVSFPWVAAGHSSGGLASAAICFGIDCSIFSADGADIKAAAAAVLDLIGHWVSPGPIDLCAIGFGGAGLTTTSITRRAAATSDVAAVKSWINGLNITDRDCLPQDGMTAAKAFFDGTDAGITNRILIWLTDGSYRNTSADTEAAGAATQAILESIAPSPLAYTMGTSRVVSSNPAWLAYTDNTPEDGTPLVSGGVSGLSASIEAAIFGSSTTPGSSYTVPPLAPPSGAPLDPLPVPIITSVTPDYPDSGGGVQGARLSIVVDDPGLDNLAWKVRWKLHADSVWASAGDNLTAAGSPLTLLTGLLAASGSVDVQVAYLTATQTSSWSATTTVTVSAAVPSGVVSSTSKSASFTTTAANSVYFLDTAGAAYTVTLNATPAANELVEVWDATGHAGANPISFDGNGKTIAGSATLTNFIHIDNGHARLIYNGTQWLIA